MRKVLLNTNETFDICKCHQFITCRYHAESVDLVLHETTSDESEHLHHQWPEQPHPADPVPDDILPDFADACLRECVDPTDPPAERPDQQDQAHAHDRADRDFDAHEKRGQGASKSRLYLGGSAADSEQAQQQEQHQ